MDEGSSKLTREKVEGPLTWAHDPKAGLTKKQAEGPVTGLRAGGAKVVNVRNFARYDVYIGRENRRRGLPESIWHNPFKIGRDGTRAEILKKYEEYVRGRPDLLARLSELEGKTLGCWCAPKACHGDVLLRLLEGRN